MRSDFSLKIYVLVCYVSVLTLVNMYVPRVEAERPVRVRGLSKYTVHHPQVLY